jgi:hypothetical protein
MFGTLAQLGYDTSIRPVLARDSPDNEPLYWEFDVEGLTYRTVEPPTYEAASHLLSRGCRVWLVRQVLQDQLVGDILVLKDFYPYLGVLEERQIQDNILKELNSTDAKKLRKHFLTIKHEVCIITADGISGSEIGATPLVPDNFVRREWTPMSETPTAPGMLSKHSQPGTASRDSMHIYKNPNVPARREHKNLDRRVHRRVVFTEQGQTVYDVPNFYDLLRCLRDIVIGPCVITFHH